MTWLIIGVSGVTCGGKSSLAQVLRDTLPNAQLICQDDYFLPVESADHSWIPELHHINWEIMTSLDMDKMWNTICGILENNKLAKSKFPKILIIEGFLILNYQPIADICHLKYHLTLTEDQCRERRNARTYNPPDVPGFFDVCIWPEYLKHKAEMLQRVEDVIIIDGSKSKHEIIERVLEEVGSFAERKSVMDVCEILNSVGTSQNIP